MLTGDLEVRSWKLEVRGNNLPSNRSNFTLPTSDIQRPAHYGMTLIEILVVLGVIGLILGMGVPALLGYGKGVRLKTTTQQIVGLVTLARSLAISSRQNHAVIMNPERREVSIVNQASGETFERVVHLPEALSVEMRVGGQPATEWQLVFRPSGSLTGRTVSIVLSDGTREQTIAVTGPTGAVSVN